MGTQARNIVYLDTAPEDRRGDAANKRRVVKQAKAKHEYRHGHTAAVRLEPPG